MDSLRLGLLAVFASDSPHARRGLHRHERSLAEKRQSVVISWIAEKKLQHKDIAAVIGVHPANFTAVLTGWKQLPKAWINPLAALLEVTPDTLRKAWRPWRSLRQYSAILPQEEQHVRHVLQELMQERRVRQKDLARAINVKQCDVSRILTGRRRIPSYWHEPLARFFNVPIATFELPESERSPAPPPPPKPRRRQKQARLTRKNQHARQVIANLLLSRKVRQQHLAAALGTSQPCVSKALNGYKSIPDSWYPVLATFFNVAEDVFECS